MNNKDKNKILENCSKGYKKFWGKKDKELKESFKPMSQPKSKEIEKEIIEDWEGRLEQALLNMSYKSDGTFVKYTIYGHDAYDYLRELFYDEKEFIISQAQSLERERVIRKIEGVAILKIAKEIEKVGFPKTAGIIRKDWETLKKSLGKPKE